MLEIRARGSEGVTVQHLVLDVHRTLMLDGQLLMGPAERLMELRRHLALHMLYDATCLSMAGLFPPESIAGAHSISLDVLSARRSQKAEIVRGLREEGVIAIGNADEDTEMLSEATLGIAILGKGGLSTSALLAADLLAQDINQALDLLLYPGRLTAALRP